MLYICNQRPNSMRGFTLIELVIGMLVFAIAMTMMISAIFPLVNRSVEPIYQIRATKLANSLLSEIQAKAFDEGSNLSLGGNRCGEGATPVDCTSPEDLGPDPPNSAVQEIHDDFDDVDDFNGFTIDGALLSQTDTTFADLYVGYELAVTVIYDSDYDGIDDNVIGTAKLITVKVTMPNQETLSFASYRSNF